MAPTSATGQMGDGHECKRRHTALNANPQCVLWAAAPCTHTSPLQQLSTGSLLRSALDGAHVAPAGPRDDAHRQRRQRVAALVERAEVLHALLDGRGGGVHLVGGHLPQQLVVQLRAEPRVHAPRGERGGAAHHRLLDNVCGRALDDRVDRLPLGLGALRVRARRDMRQQPAAAAERSDGALASRLRLERILQRLELGEGAEELRAERARLRDGHAERRGEPLDAEAVA
eukprot:4131217-Prymnesium_polylepis.1